MSKEIEVTEVTNDYVKERWDLLECAEAGIRTADLDKNKIHRLPDKVEYGRYIREETPFPQMVEEIAMDKDPVVIKVIAPLGGGKAYVTLDIIRELEANGVKIRNPINTIGRGYTSKISLDDLDDSKEGASLFVVERDPGEAIEIAEAIIEQVEERSIVFIHGYDDHGIQFQNEKFPQPYYIKVPSFSEEEVRGLSIKLGLSLGEGDVEIIHSLTAGHPEAIRRSLDSLKANPNMPIEEALRGGIELAIDRVAKKVGFYYEEEIVREVLPILGQMVSFTPTSGILQSFLAKNGLNLSPVEINKLRGVLTLFGVSSWNSERGGYVIHPVIERLIHVSEFLRDPVRYRENQDFILNTILGEALQREVWRRESHVKRFVNQLEVRVDLTNEEKVGYMKKLEGCCPVSE